MQKIVNVDDLAAYQLCPASIVLGSHKTKTYKDSVEMIGVFEKLLSMVAEAKKKGQVNAMKHISGQFEKELHIQKLKGASFQQINEWDKAWALFSKRFSLEFECSHVLSHGLNYRMLIKDNEIHHVVPAVYLRKDIIKGKVSWVFKMIIIIKDERIIKVKSRLMASPYIIFALDAYRSMMGRDMGAENGWKRNVRYLPLELEFIHPGRKAESIILDAGDINSKSRSAMKKSLMHLLCCMKQDVMWPIYSEACKKCPVQKKCPI